MKPRKKLSSHTRAHIHLLSSCHDRTQPPPQSTLAETASTSLPHPFSIFFPNVMGGRYIHRSQPAHVVTRGLGDAPQDNASGAVDGVPLLGEAHVGALHPCTETCRVDAACRHHDRASRGTIGKKES